MSAALSAVDFMLQVDRRRFIEEHLGSDPWVTVYSSPPDEFATFFCALVPNGELIGSLENKGWDLLIGDGKPGCSIRYEGRRQVVTYHRFGGSTVEPFILVRQFHGLRPGYPEISEEFRLFHNLLHDPRTNTYLRFKENGDEEEVVRVTDREVKIRLKEIRQFLAIKEMHLAIFFDCRRFCSEELATLKLGAPVVVQKDLLRYEVLFGDWDRDGNKSLSRLVGKKLIPPLPKDQSGFWPFESRTNDHVEFIVGVDASGEPILHSCDPKILSYGPARDPDALGYLTQVFFKREVLTKYYAKPSMYSVQDGLLSCAGLWSVQIDTDLKDHVVVFLGDLGRDLPREEQLHWRTYNVAPEGGISPTHFRRSFLAEFTDPERPELLFKLSLERLRRSWLDQFSWELFKPLSKDDAHLLATLRVPLTDEQAEFDSQVLALTKILIDSLNEAQLQKVIPPQPKGTKGITKFEQFLLSKGMPDAQKHIKFMRNLQSLRSGVGHRKGDDYERACEEFGIPAKTLRTAFETILGNATSLLDALERHLLVQPAPPPVPPPPKPSKGQ